MDWKPFLIHKAAVFLLLLLLTAGALAIQGGILETAARQFPEAVAFRAPAGKLSFLELSTVEPPEGTAYSMAGRKTALAINVTAPSELEEVSLYLTDEAYSRAVPFEMLYGSYFTLSPVPEENRFIVISDRLAVRFFLTDNAVGRTLEVDGVECTVCGVYRSRRSLLNRVSSDGREAVYMPYSALPETPAAQVLYVKTKDTLFLQRISDDVDEAFGYPQGFTSSTSYPELYRLAEQCRKATLFLCGMAVVCLLAALLWGRCKRALSALQGEHRRDALRPGTGALLCAAGIAVSLLLSCYRSDVPPRYLPADDIFDLRYYLQNAVEAIQARNGAEFYDFYWNLSQNVLLWEAVWGALSVGLFLLAFFYAVGVGRRSPKC